MSFRDLFSRASAAEKRRRRQAAANKANRHGTTPLFEAIERGHYSDVSALIAQGADIAARSKAQGFLSSLIYDVPYAAGSTPLHVAALLGKTDIAQLLIRKGADVQARNHDGHTPLDCALISHAWCEDNYTRKSQAALTPRFKARHAREQRDAFVKTIQCLMAAGGKTGLLELPAAFRALLPEAIKKENKPGPA